MRGQSIAVETIPLSLITVIPRLKKGVVFSYKHHDFSIMVFWVSDPLFSN